MNKSQGIKAWKRVSEANAESDAAIRGVLVSETSWTSQGYKPGAVGFADCYADHASNTAPAAASLPLIIHMMVTAGWNDESIQVLKGITAAHIKAYHNSVKFGVPFGALPKSPPGTWHVGGGPARRAAAEANAKRFKGVTMLDLLYERVEEVIGWSDEEPPE